MTTHIRRTNRAGFTLVELLVVIAIIAVLLALTAAALTGVLRSSEDGVTETTLTKIDTGLQRHWKAVVDQARRETIPTALLRFTNQNENAARVLYTKLKLRAEFPVTFAEARLDPAVFGVDESTLRRVGLNRKLYTQALPPDGSANPEEQAAICLVLALRQNRRGVDFNPETAFGAGVLESRNFGGVSCEVLVDSYGGLIKYVRWPIPPAYVAEYNMAPFAKVQGGVPVDPVDPERWLQNAIPAGQVGLIQTMIGHPIAPVQNYYPFAVSAGRDEQFGTDDDIVSYRLREAGRRGDS